MADRPTARRAHDGAPRRVAFWLSFQRLRGPAPAGAGVEGPAYERIWRESVETLVAGMRG
jgi:hypothetical protein